MRRVVDAVVVDQAARGRPSEFDIEVEGQPADDRSMDNSESGADHCGSLANDLDSWGDTVSTCKFGFGKI